MDGQIAKILVVDDEKDIRELVTYNLKREGYITITADNGEKAISLAKEERPDLVLLDIMLPKMDGIEVCQQLRQIPELNQTLIAFLTARGEDYSQIAGFAAGGDDYITKPIKPKLLIARIKALLKRQLTDERMVSVSINEAIYIDTEKRLLFKDSAPIELPKKEYELLLLLSSKPGKVFTRERIYQSLWGNDLTVGDRTIDVHIRKLREKIGDDLIKTIKGVGYKLKDHKAYKKKSRSFFSAI